MGEAYYGRKKVRDGAEEWQRFLTAAGVQNIDSSHAELLYLANGCNIPKQSAGEELDAMNGNGSDETDDDV